MVVLLLVSPLLSACGSGTSTGGVSDTPPALTKPPPWQLTSPSTAVVSYLYWISFAYRVSDSDMASQTFTPFEEVRVNSYVHYNDQEGRAIDQKLTDLNIRTVATKDGTATVTAHEEWTYRYISLKTGKYAGPGHEAAYDSTYTVVRDPEGLWRVDRVEASATVDVK